MNNIINHNNLLDISLWKKQKSKDKKSNYIYISPKNIKYYGKLSKVYELSETEILSSKLYNLAGLKTPDFFLARDKEYFVILSKFNENLKKFFDVSNIDKKKIINGYVIDAWLANWDIYKNNNIQFTEDNNPIRIDNGGSLDYRAGGKKKGTDGTYSFGNKVTELESLKEYNKKNPYIFNISDKEIVYQARNLQKINNDSIKSLIYQNVKNKERAKKLIKILIARKKSILKKVYLMIKKYKNV